MGGNSSYSKEWGGVPTGQRTHTDSNYRIEGHKVVYFKDNCRQKKNILNSNSTDAIYLIAQKHSDATIEINSVNVFKGHHLSYEINLVFDSNGNIMPFNDGKGSHAHIWQKDPADGILKRKSHDKNNSFAIDPRFYPMISKIELFNRQKNK